MTANLGRAGATITGDQRSVTRNLRTEDERVTVDVDTSGLPTAFAQHRTRSEDVVCNCRYPVNLIDARALLAARRSPSRVPQEQARRPALPLPESENRSRRPR